MFSPSYLKDFVAQLAFEQRTRNSLEKTQRSFCVASEKAFVSLSKSDMGRPDVDVSLRRAESLDLHDQTGTCALATSHVARSESGASACRARRMASFAENASWSRDALSMSTPSDPPTLLPDALAVNALDCPPPYSMVAQESTHCPTLSSREPLVRSSSEP